MGVSRAIAVALLAVMLAGCVTKNAAITCPSLKTYSEEFQKFALSELGRVNAPHLEQMLNDYGVTRDAIRTCIKRRGKK